MAGKRNYYTDSRGILFIMTGFNDSLKIMSLNMAYGLFYDDLIKYLLDHTDSISIFCLQEVDEKTKETLDNLLADHYTGYYATKANIDSRDFSLAIYVRRTIKVLDHFEILSSAPNTGSSLSCLLEDSCQQRYYLTNVHGVSQPGTKLDSPARLIQSQTLVDCLPDDQTVSIIVGDFNLMPETESLEIIRRHGYHDLIAEFEIPTTRNEVVWQRWPGNKQLYADYAFVRGLEAPAYDFKVEDIIISDHLPLLLSIQIASATSSAKAAKLATGIDNN